MLRILPLLFLAACAAQAPVPAVGEGADAVVGARNAHTGARVGQRLFVFGGINNRGAQPAERTVSYDCVTGAWAEHGPLATYRWFASAVTLGDEVLLLGGGSREVPFYRLVEAYDPSSDTWRDVAPMEHARNRFAAVVLDGLVYAIGGYAEGGNLTTVEVYDPARDTWTAAAPLHVARHGHTAVVHDGRIVVVGGYATSGEDQERARTVEVFDPRSGRWELGAALPASRGFHGAAVLDGALYVFQGRNMAPEPTLRAEDPGAAFRVADTAPPHLRNRYVTLTHGGRAWLLGGEGHADSDVIVQVFEPGAGWTLPAAQAPK